MSPFANVALLATDGSREAERAARMAVELTRSLDSGRPEAGIVQVAEEIGADLIVLGSRGLGGVRRALMGSVSDSVVRHAHGPVVVVRG